MKWKKNKNFNKVHCHGISTQLNLTPPIAMESLRKKMGLVVNLAAIEFDSSNRLCQLWQLNVRLLLPWAEIEVSVLRLLDWRDGSCRTERDAMAGSIIFEYILKYSRGLYVLNIFR
ncbi:unnamed protein product, partial [Prunus brigantina]